MARAGTGAGLVGLCAFRRLGVELAVVTASVRRVWVRPAVAIVVALAAACVCVPAAQAWSNTMQIAFQADTGDLWTWTIGDPGSNTGLGMRAGTNPSVTPSASSGSNHQIAFQANTGALWTASASGVSNTGLGMAAGTSPSIDGSGVAFQANTGNLWTVKAGGVWSATPFGMVAGTSPSRAAVGDVAFQAKGGNLWYLDEGDTGVGMKAGTSPSLNDNPATQVAFQGSNGNLFAGTVSTNLVLGPPDLHLGMKAGTSPSINDENDIAFQANTGDLYLTYDENNGPGGDTGAKMMPGTSPSIDDQDDIAFQGSNGDLWIWIAPAKGVASGAHDLGLGMKAGTSPSISRDPGLVGGARPQTSQIGGPGNDRLNGGSRNDLIYGGRGNDRIRGRRGNDQLYGGPGNDQIYGGPGNDQIYGGPGNDRIYGGAGNDRIYGGPGNDRIVDHGGATTVLPGSGTNWVDVADRRGGDRVVCAPGSTNHIVADRGDRIARSCRGKRSTIRYVRGR
jgi:Ca2+-binding RTX toxin-like protein